MVIKCALLHTEYLLSSVYIVAPNELRPHCFLVGYINAKF